MSTIIWLNAPDGGAEAEMTLLRRHNCPNARSFRRAMDDDGVDELEFPVGVAGRGMPGDTPFVVTAVHPCRVCGALPSMWAAWRKRLIA